MIKRFAFPLLLLLPLTLLCHAAFAETISVYFGTRGSAAKGIYHATFDTQTGKLGEAQLAATLRDPGFLAFDPQHAHLYAAGHDGEQPVIAAYEIDQDGQLVFINAEPVGDGGAAHLSVHPSGRFLLTAQYGGGSVALFPISEDGSIQPRGQLIEHSGGSGVVPNQQNKPHPHWTGYSPDARFAFIADLGTDQIVIYKIEESFLSISPHSYAETIPGGGPRHMKFSADGRFIYLLNEIDVSVTTFEYNPEAGTAERIDTTPALTREAKAKEQTNSGSEILVHPNGRFVYSGNRGHDSVTVYRSDSQTGQLTVTEVEPIRGAWPRNINLDPTGKWLLAAGSHSNTVAVFAIDPDSGELTYQPFSVISVPAPICIVFKDDQP